MAAAAEMNKSHHHLKTRNRKTQVILQLILTDILKCPAWLRNRSLISN